MRLLRWIKKQYSKLIPHTGSGLMKSGDWRVRYPDGKCSVWFTYDCAGTYRDIFGGEIEYRG